MKKIVSIVAVIVCMAVSSFAASNTTWRSAGSGTTMDGRVQYWERTVDFSDSNVGADDIVPLFPLPAGSIVLAAGAKVTVTEGKVASAAYGYAGATNDFVQINMAAAGTNLASTVATFPVFTTTATELQLRVGTACQTGSVSVFAITVDPVKH